MSNLSNKILSFLDKKYQNLLNTLSLYDDLHYSNLTKNKSNYTKKLYTTSDTIGIDFSCTYSKENISYYYLINEMPRELRIRFKNIIRNECSYGIKITFINYLENHFIDWDSPAMQSRLNTLKEVSEEKKQTDVDAYNLHKNIDSINKQKYIEESLNYLSIADKQRGRGIMKSSILMIISGPRGSLFDYNIKKMEQCTKNLGIKTKRILYEIPDFLKYFSPFSHLYLKSVKDYIPAQIITDEIVSRYSTYEQGTLGEEGICFGIDINSRFPVFKKVKQESVSAENWLVTSETGWGKSLFVKSILLQLIAAGFKITIMDIEGTEYIPMANFLSHNSKVEILNMGDGTGKYFESMEIAPKTGIREIDEKAKALSLDFTRAKLRALLGKEFDKDTWLSVVLEDAIGLVYSEAGITDEESTWVNSKGLSIFDVYDKLKSLSSYNETHIYRTNTEYKNAVKKAIALTSRYFEKNGTMSHTFKEKVNIDSLMSADLIICSFGMEGKSQHAVDETQLTLMQIEASILSHLRSIYSKAQGCFNVKLWEEFQRWGKFPDSDKTLGVAVTGGRKIGDVNIIVTNDVQKLLDDDKFGIFSNTTSFFVGAIKDTKVIDELVTRLQVPQFKPTLYELSSAKRIKNKNQHNKNSSSKISSHLQNAFLFSLDSDKIGLTRMELPNDVASSKIFKTGVNLKN
ncbi:AAA-like domain protein [Clostridioides difficile CD160]|nr:AAA-like domain protein [Clostridioides difficile CD160]